MLKFGLRRKVLSAAAFSLIVVAGSGAAFAQGRGHGGEKGGRGGGNGRGNGQGQQQQDRGQRGEQRFERQQMQQQRFEQRQRPQPQARQQIFMGPPIREQNFPGRGNEKRNENADRGRREIQIQQQYQIMRQREDSDRRNWQRQHELSYDRAPRDSGRRDRYQRARVFPQQNPYGGFYGYKNYGQYRSQQVHERNAERKAWRNEERSFRRDRISTNYYYTQPYYGDSRRDRWREYALRNIIVNVRQYGGDRGRSYLPQYYAPQQPTYYSYQSYAVDPFYGSPYDAAYYPQYGTYDSPYSYVADLPAGNDYLRDTCGRLVAVGYEQGYADGLAAARARRTDVNYYDPYVYNQTTYDPYSSSLGMDRRYLSDGYGLGFQDALDGDYGQDLYNDNQVDLVSLLIGSALQMFSS
ncbi:MAG: hypothetical protein QM785_13085 [Pyrinomonadaceae bacterium]